MSAELEQFCTLAKTQRGAACAHLIVKAISHKNVFCFGEMLDLPSIQTVSTLFGYCNDAILTAGGQRS